MTRKDALQYVKNTGGAATPQHFWEDWEPVGVIEWNSLLSAGLVEVNAGGFIQLTAAGSAKLKELSK